MRKVTENEIYDLDNNRVSTEYFMQHAPKYKHDLLKYVHHVDTHLHLSSEGKLWRVQGYISLEDFPILAKTGAQHIYFDSYIGIEEDVLALWTLFVPYID